MTLVDALRIYHAIMQQQIIDHQGDKEGVMTAISPWFIACNTTGQSSLISSKPRNFFSFSFWEGIFASSRKGTNTFTFDKTWVKSTFKSQVILTEGPSDEGSWQLQLSA
jgi:hypothetical protein